MSNTEKIYQTDLSDRRNVFYWQTDRDLTPEDYLKIFLQRHEIPTARIEAILREGVTSLGALQKVLVEEPDVNVVLGNVNIVRKVSINGIDYVARLHPAGVKNGYFYTEREALKAAIKNNIPAPEVVEIHEALKAGDMDFILTKKSPGITMDILLKNDPANEAVILRDCGVQMAKIHQIGVEGFGPFDNQQAKVANRLVGLHRSYHVFIRTGLVENLQRLVFYEILTEKQTRKMSTVFEKYSFKPLNGPRLIHNDFADWNLLTDGKKITAVLDWDESHAGDPIADLACWSTFFSMERMQPFLEGYKTLANLPDDFEIRFHYYRLRYTISKMALRIKRYQVDKSDFVKDKLKVGRQALLEETAFFGV